MATITLEIPDELADEWRARGLNEDYFIEAMEMAVSFDRYQTDPDRVREADEQRAELEQEEKQAREEYEAATLPDVVEACNRLLKSVRRYQDRKIAKHRMTMYLRLDDAEIAVLAWVELVRRARARRESVKGLRVNPRKPEHQAVAAGVIRNMVRNDFHHELAMLSWGQHRLLAREEFPPEREKLVSPYPRLPEEDDGIPSDDACGDAFRP